ncbi:MAG: hypothetical protein ABI442_13005 [Gemmatimonadaceae bacterium]
MNDAQAYQAVWVLASAWRALGERRGRPIYQRNSLVGCGAPLPLRAFLYGIAATDPLSYRLVALLFVAVALIANAGPRGVRPP